jgi:hypothetical protein
MSGLAFTATQPNGVTTTFATVLDIRWQPGKSADIQIGYFVDEPTFSSGASPVFTQYLCLNISLIDPTQPIPPQIISQLTAVGAPLAGGTPVA